MTENEGLKNNLVVILRLIARIWAIIILMIAIIFLVGYIYNWVTLKTADPYQVEEAHPPLVFLGIIGLAIALKREKIGGIITVLAGILHLGEEIYLWIFNSEVPRLITFVFADELNYSTQYYLTPYIVVLFIMVPGILFIIYSFLKRK